MMLLKSTGRFCRTSSAVMRSTAVRSLNSTQSQHRMNYYQKPFEDSPRVSIITEIPNTPGSLHNILGYFWKYDIDMTSIESRPTPTGHEGFLMYVDFKGQVGESNTDKLLDALKRVCRDTLVIDSKEVPWFPRHVTQLDLIANRVMNAGEDLESDHPGFNDPVYRARRGELATIAKQYSLGEPIPHIVYTEQEIATWGAVYDRLGELQGKYACKAYLEALEKMQRFCGYSNSRIPQAQDISDFLMSCTGFRLRPVAGLLSSRDFLNGLAFRCFFSTQYIRHHSMPLYTPEPDICHELLGHAPMFADPDFADFSQEIGLASLGASDEVITKLASCYWYSVEFGLLKEDGMNKAYGAGLLSSFGELEYSCSPDRPAGGTEDRPELRPWNPVEASMTEFPITTYQPTYFVAENLQDAKVKMRQYCENIKKPFHARYNPLTSTIWVDRAVKFSQDVPAASSGPY